VKYDFKLADRPKDVTQDVEFSMEVVEGDIRVYAEYAPEGSDKKRKYIILDITAQGIRRLGGVGEGPFELNPDGKIILRHTKSH
jgi:hypothetical protein